MLQKEYCRGTRKREKCSKSLLYTSAKTKSPSGNEVGDGRREKRMTLLIHQPVHFNMSFQVAFIRHFRDLRAVAVTMIRIKSTASY